ncbi:hypothetical protein [Paracoccus halophilus]|uniref:hypothetical protein n=1 Tax=Paracoccus halophilus TaxID=376733 RepID=UPI0005682520|nr:hypothetical protein [Paracoccus halophilus]
MRIAAFGRCILTRGDSGKPNAARVPRCTVALHHLRRDELLALRVLAARSREIAGETLVSRSGCLLVKMRVWRQARQAISTAYHVEMLK